MSDRQKKRDIELLARMAARLAGRDPNDHLKLKLGNIVAFEGLMWRYPDFLTRAEAAYELLVSYPIRDIELRQYHKASKKTA